MDETRLLVFSGGVTKRSKTTLSEATSYLNLAIANELFGHPASLASRILTDDNATDSFQNLLFPLVLFASHATGYPMVGEPGQQRTKEWQGFPKHMTIIGHEFKRRRFEELHLPAIRWTRDPAHFKYVGIDPPMDTEKRLQVLNGETLRGFRAWQNDMYGTREVLASKRTTRGWCDDKKKEVEIIVSRGWQHSVLKHNILDLLSWSGGANGHEIYPDRLPWDGLDNCRTKRITQEADDLAHRGRKT